MASKKGGVAAKVEEMARPVIEQLGLRLWDVRYEKEGPENFLRVFIDRDTPLDTDACEAASRAIDPLLDEADLIQESYYLEVGSPGLGRKLARPEHFAAMAGREAYAKRYTAGEDGRKELRGLLGAADEEGFTLETAEGPVRLTYRELALAKLTDDEGLFD